MGDVPAWSPERPRLHPVRLVIAWLVSALGLMLAAAVVPGAELRASAGRWPSRASSAFSTHCCPRSSRR